MPSAPNRSAVARRSTLGIWMQGSLALGAGLLTLLPPSQGTMLIVPLPGHDEGAALRVALASNARLVARGPIAGSYVVEGSRAPLLTAAARHFMLVFATDATGCSPKAAS
jgi:hypothetical protein